MQENISEHITYAEAIKSPNAVRLGISNAPNPTQLASMKSWAKNIFEKVRSHFGGKPIYVSSFFRSPELNEHTPNSSTTSQHCKGEAGDLDADVFGGMTNKEIFVYIMNNLDFDQLIWEYGTPLNPDWVHVSYKESGNRKMILQTVVVKNQKTGKNEVKYLAFNIKL